MDSVVTLSVIVPIFKGEKYLQDLCVRLDLCSHTLFRAGIELVDLIFVCDEPVDNSVLLARELANDYSFIKVIELGANSGQHIATSVGILSAQGDWICTIDEDLQHPPEIMLNLLSAILSKSGDIIYVKGSSSTHPRSLGRGFTSWLAKVVVTFMTGIDYSKVSSFRMIRAQVARSAAACMDKNHYLDVGLLSITSPKRQLVYELSLVDNRPHGDSGYTIKSLIKHFSRLFFSSSVSGSKSFFVGIIPLFMAVFLFSALFLARAFVTGIYSITPGWASLFSLQLIILAMLAFIAAYLVKMLGVIATRASGIPPFMIVDRSADPSIYERIMAGRVFLP